MIKISKFQYDISVKNSLYKLHLVMENTKGLKALKILVEKWFYHIWP